MTSVASEAFALLNRPSSSSRTAASKSDGGGFAALMETHSDIHDTPKSSRPERHERVSSRRTERDAPADKPAATEAAPQDDSPAKADDASSTDAPAEKPASEASSATETADTPAGETDNKDEAAVVTGIIPADPAQIAVPVIAAVTAPIAITPTEAAVAEAAPPAAPLAPATDIPATAAPAATTPDQQATADTTGQTATPAEPVAVPGGASETAGQDKSTPAIIAPQIKAQTATKEKSDKTATDETALDGETSLDTAAPEALDDATKQAKQPTASTATAAQAQDQTQIEKPGVKPEHGLKPDDLLAAPKLTANNATQVMTQMPAHMTAATATTASPVGNGQAVPLNAVAVEIAVQAKAGNSRFEIRLDPAELGRIDVRLDVDKDGNVSSRLVIERADTYDLLRRDQSTLERALQQAGLKTSDNSLEFSLRDQGFAQQQRQDQETSRGVRTLVAESDVMPSEAANGYARLLGGRSGVDIRV